MPPAETPEPLSDIPSVAILQALDDLEKCERDPRYVIDMQVWHEPRACRGVQVCGVCLAGSVMSQRYLAPLDEDIWPVGMNDLTDHLLALDSFREGDVWDGVRRFGVQCELPDLPDEMRIAEYSTDPAAFKSDMRKLAALLAEHGL